MEGRYFFIKILITVICVNLLCSCNKDVYTGTAEIERHGSSKLVINSYPIGAAIYLNGKNMGIVTPDSIPWLSSGNYTVTLKMNLFNDIKLNIDLDSSARTQLNYDYYSDSKNFGNIYCSSTPSDAMIYLNDSDSGLKTPALIKQLFPGEYKIKLIRTSCREDSDYVTVYGGRTLNINLVMDDTTHWVTYRTNNCPIPSNNISKVLVDRKNTKWVGTPDKGLACFDGKEWKLYSKNNSPLISDYINCMILDVTDRLWIGTANGLVSFDGNVWTNYSSYLPAEYVTDLVQDISGNIWVGTQGGLVKYNGTTWKVYQTSSSSIAENFITALACDKLNRLWIGTSAHGINVFDGLTWKVYNMSNMNLGKYIGNSIHDLASDKNGIIWASHNQNTITKELGGITVFDGNSWVVKQINDIPTNTTETIFVDGYNTKWIGTKSGLIVYVSDSDIRYFTTINSKLPSSRIETITIDANGDLFVGSWGGGLGKLKKGNF
jgi:hypothetical protein